MPPKVQSLADIMAELAPGYQGQKDVLARQAEQVQTDTQNTITGLKAQRGEAWNDIGRSANARGFAFGGIRADEQARYDSLQFMPAVANAESSGIKAGNELLLAGAQLDTDARNNAMSWRQNQQQALNQWNMQQAQLEAQRRENELNRQFEASQNAMNRSAQSAANAGPNAQQWLASQFAQISGSDPNWRKNYSTENAALVSQFAANYGVSRDEALKAVYGYRKQNFGF